MKRKLLYPALLMAGSLLFCLLALEAALRIAGLPLKEAKVLCFDPIIGNVFCPGIEARLDNMYNSTLAVRFNSEGMADREYPRAKPPGVIRIALLGDSVTASIYTPPDRKFAGLWEQALSQRLGKPVEVLNFAIDGASTWDELQLFHLRARHFRPDYVVLGFFWGNDVWNNEMAQGMGGPSPLHDEYPPRSWYQDLRVAHRKAIRWLWNHSLAYQFVGSLKDKVEAIFWYRRSVQKAGEAQPEVKADVAQKAGPVYDPAFAWNSSGWDLTRRLILKLKQESDAAGAGFAVFHIPMYDQLVLPRPLPYTELRAFLAQNGIGNVDAFDALAPLPRERLKALYIGDRVHLTVEGHRIMAEATVPRLDALLRASRTER